MRRNGLRWGARPLLGAVLLLLFVFLGTLSGWVQGTPLGGRRLATDTKATLAPLHVPYSDPHHPDLIEGQYMVVFHEDAPADAVNSHLQLLATQLTVLQQLEPLTSLPVVSADKATSSDGATKTKRPHMDLFEQVNTERQQQHLSFRSEKSASSSPALASFLELRTQQRQRIHATKKRNQIRHVYNLPHDQGGLRGYSGNFDPEIVALIRESENVAYVEQDQMVYTTKFQHDAPWGLSRISHRELPTDEHYTEYPYPKHAGANVTAYIIDTGIFIRHSEFEGRASWGKTIPSNDVDEDGNGHGTHCAGTIGSKTYGVAKQAHLVAVKVLSSDGSGTMSDVVKGVEWAAQDHSRRKKKDKSTRSAANMSLGGGKARTLDRAVNAAVRLGVHFAVAAGNDNANACNYSPASATEAVTVGATDVNDRMAWFSNHGKCVDLFAPGKDIRSTWIGSKHATKTISGTSMASPHACGVLAFLLSQKETRDMDPRALKSYLAQLATKNHIKGLPDSSKKHIDDGDEDEGPTPNLLLFTGYKGHHGGKEPPPPTPPSPSPAPEPGTKAKPDNRAPSKHQGHLSYPAPPHRPDHGSHYHEEPAHDVMYSVETNNDNNNEEEDGEAADEAADRMHAHPVSISTETWVTHSIQRIELRG